MKEKKKFRRQLMLVVVGVTLFWALFNLGSILSVLRRLMKILSPCIIGFLLAMILNVPMSAIERTFFKPDKDNNYGPIKAKIKRPLSLAITLVLCFGVIAAMLSLLIPEIIDTVSKMYTQVPELVNRISRHISDSKLLARWFPELNFDTAMITDRIQTALKDSELLLSTLNSTYNMASSLISTVINFIIGLFFAIYMLLQKEKLKVQLYRITTAFVNEKTARRLCYVCNMSKETFSKFISGQGLEACILGSLTCIGMLIFGFPNAFAVGVLVAVTAFIPIVGAIIGCAIGAFFIMFTSIKKALFFVLFMIILQQLENNLIYPKVVGKSVGLPSLWVLFAITVGGAMGGMLGMFISVPACSIIYCLVRELVDYRHRQLALERGEVPEEEAPSEPQPAAVTAEDNPEPEEA
ncbi:MAG: AI-2E family transporter [Ruminococcus sp.]|nr:AI-2E family transporter [Ruminococcus sp.]